MGMKDLEVFAEGQQNSSTVLRHSDLVMDILKYYEPALVLDELFVDGYIDKLSAIIPADVEEFDEMAVEVPENVLAPIFRSKRESIPVKLNKLQVRYEITDEAEIEDPFGDVFELEAERSGVRLARKEDYDYSKVLAGFTYSQAATVTGKLSPYDVALAKTELVNRGHQADYLVMNPTQFADIEGEVTVQNMEYTSEDAKVKGYTFATYMGLKILQSPKITPGVVYVIDRSSQPLRMIRNVASKTDTYRNPGTSEGVVISVYNKPYLFRPKAGQKITSC